jgi:hypothetical protein
LPPALEAGQPTKEQPLVAKDNDQKTAGTGEETKVGKGKTEAPEDIQKGPRVPQNRERS